MNGLRILVLVMAAGLLGVVGCSLPPRGNVPASSPLRPFEAPDEDELVADDGDDDDDGDEQEDMDDADADADDGAGEVPATQPAADPAAGTADTN